MTDLSPMRTELIVLIVSLALLAFASQQLMAAKAVIGAVVGG